MGSAREFLDAPRDAKTVSFLDGATLDEIDRLAVELGANGEHPPDLRRLVTAVSLGHVVAVCDQQPTAAIGWFRKRPWLSHVISTSLLDGPVGEDHLATLVTALDTTREPKVMDFLSPSPEGRRVRLTHSKQRDQRLEKMLEFYRGKGVSSDLVDRLRDVADALIVNAFYDAPAAVGVEAPRTKDIALPSDLACDLVYGQRDGLAFLRVRDPFGSLTRELVAAGLGRPAGGLARVFTAASIVAISVVANQRTDVLVALRERPAKPDPFAFHMFFKPGPKRGMWKTLSDDTGDPNSPSSSVSIMVD